MLSCQAQEFGQTLADLRQDKVRGRTILIP
jgi:hypothetical protein